MKSVSRCSIWKPQSTSTIMLFELQAQFHYIVRNNKKEGIYLECEYWAFLFTCLCLVGILVLLCILKALVCLVVRLFFFLVHCYC